MTAPAPSSVPSGARRGEGLYELSLMAGLQGLPDPVAAADELLAIDAERLAGWFTVARRAADWLRRGADLLADAIPALTAAWSSPTPQASIAALREAGLASRTVIVGQADAADLACSTLTQVKVHVEAELSAAEAAVAALPPVTSCVGSGAPAMLGTASTQAHPNLIARARRTRPAVTGPVRTDHPRRHPRVAGQRPLTNCRLPVSW